MISRRRFCFGAGLGSALASRTLAAPPPGRMVRFGYVGSGPIERRHMIESAIDAGLREQGYVEGKNLFLERRFALFPDGPMRRHINDLMSMNLDVLITGCGWSTRLASRVPNAPPIVFVSVTDPVGAGYVKSLARPGGNITGISGFVPGLGPKMIEYLHAALPEARQIGALLDLREDRRERLIEPLRKTARAHNVNLVPIDLNRLATEEAAREVFRAAAVDALLIVPDDGLFWEFIMRILAASDAERIPLVVPRRDLVDMGGFLSYGAEGFDIFRRGVAHADRIVNGTRPAEIPVELPTRLDFAINLRKAEAYGITVPRPLLVRADALIR